MSSTEDLGHLQIPLQEILSATNNFADENRIGLGGFGKVYKGETKKHGMVAIKRLDPGRGGQGDREFKTEIASLSKYKHKNIVSLHGFCDEKGEKLLVYEYASKGSLDNQLKNKALSWRQRILICLDAARGLKYLHDDVAPEHRILHRDVKSANILLDENWTAKISDFGFSKKRSANVHSSFVISNACGTVGYIDPEYFYTRHLTPKSDVFSLGVVLFEVLCGMQAFLEVDRQYFFLWVQKYYKGQTLDKIIHSDLHEQINTASLLTFSTVAYRCLSNREERPTMKEVVEQLRIALDFQVVPSGPRSKVYHDHDFAALHQRQSRETTSSSQLSPVNSQSRKYDIFLTFRGADPRKSFVAHLYSALAQQQVFKDELLLGTESIGSSLFNAIKESKIAIPIFSENYASSTWCLSELAHIMKCKVERGLIVIPVFYHVDPLQVQRQTGRYEEAFSIHESENNEKVELWRKALVDAANIPGFVVTSHESKAIEETIYAIKHRCLSFLASDEATNETGARKDLIGIEARMQDFISLLEIGSGGVRMVGICGIWGSGKSSLASFIYDDISHEFEGCCFIKNVRDESRMHGLKTLQERILSDVFKSEVILRSIEQGISMMATRLRRNRVLIVLDDVDHIDHLKMLIGSQNWFGNGSRIIFTTRNQDLVNAHNCITYNVGMLDVKEAIELFSWHAFGSVRPIEGYEKLSQSLVSKCGGHPSTLKSLGSFLHDKDMTKWKSTLARIEGIPIDEVLEKFNTGDDGVSRNTCSWLAT